MNNDHFFMTDLFKFLKSTADLNFLRFFSIEKSKFTFSPTCDL